jgi:hypothetical protein
VTSPRGDKVSYKVPKGGRGVAAKSISHGITTLSDEVRFGASKGEEGKRAL